MRLKFNVYGMTCAACSARVEKVVSKLPGVEKVDVNLLAGKMVVEAQSNQVVEQIIIAVKDAGYEASRPGQNPTIKKETSTQTPMRNRIVYSAAFLVVLMYFTMGHMLGLPLPKWYHGTENALVAVLLQFMLTIPVVILNRAYYLNGFKALIRRSPNMDSLIAVGSGAALVYGIVALYSMAYASGHGDVDAIVFWSKNLYFESAAMILTLITLGKYLESRAKDKTGDAIRKLMDLSPKMATALRDGNWVTLPIEEVRIGDVIAVRSGESIPVDGVVLSGTGAVDQSALTGESVPVEVSVGSAVSAATINTEGYLEIRTEKIGEDTTLSQIIRMVEEAGGSKAPIARLADKIAGIFVPTVMTIAAITFVVWLALGKSVDFAMNTAISVLVISCPCALGLATPVAIMVGTGKGAALGILFKDAESLENLHRIDTVVLDKTGTLTVGKPSVTDIVAVSVGEEQLLSVAASLESKSEHPFAKAIMDKVGKIPYKAADDFKTLPGQGVTAVIDHVRYYAGNDRLMESIGVSIPQQHCFARDGKTPLYFASESGALLGIIAAADTLKPDSTQAVRKLHKLGLKVVMLTGDNAETAKAIAARAGIDEVVSDVLPADKAKTIRSFQAAGRKVMMVGDGINDAPALVSADIGMAVGAGTDIAIDSANVILMNRTLSSVCEAIALSRATIRNVRQNLFWAFFYNCLGIPVAAGVLYPAFGLLLSPMLGAAAMSMSSVFVVTNALRLRFFKSGFKIENNPSCDIIKKENVDMETIIKVEGMMCPHCKARVEGVCKAIPGVTDAVVDLEKKQVTVSGDASMDALKKAILDAGYQVIE